MALRFHGTNNEGDEQRRQEFIRKNSIATYTTMPPRDPDRGAEAVNDAAQRAAERIAAYAARVGPERSIMANEAAAIIREEVAADVAELVAALDSVVYCYDVDGDVLGPEELARYRAVLAKHR